MCCKGFTDVNRSTAADWCFTNASKGGVWDIFDLVKSKLCADESGFEKPWGPIDLDQVVECPCGQSPIFPENECVEDATDISSC